MSTPLRPTVTVEVQGEVRVVPAVVTVFQKVEVFVSGHDHPFVIPLFGLCV